MGEDPDGKETITEEHPRAKTVSIRDECETRYERKRLLNVTLKLSFWRAAFAETGIEKILEDAFAGRSIDFILEKIVHGGKWTYEELEEVLTYNRQELQALYG